jgi:hypothetical protein
MTTLYRVLRNFALTSEFQCSSRERTLIQMHSKLNYCTIFVVAIFVLAPVDGQTTKPSTSNPVTFRDPVRWKFAPEPPAALERLTVQLGTALIGQSPNLSIEFVLSLENNGPKEVKIEDPLDIFSLQFTTMGKKLIPVPEKPMRTLMDRRRQKKDWPYAAPVQFRRIVRGTLASYQKEDVITIPPGGKLQIVFESEPIVMQRVREALQSETGENARLFKARVIMGLLTSPPAQTGGRSLESGWIYFKL